MQLDLDSWLFFFFHSLAVHVVYSRLIQSNRDRILIIVIIIIGGSSGADALVRGKQLNKPDLVVTYLPTYLPTYI
ncbi:hypothetical protein F4775DRAFT_574297, partial [Biscogniauxia sp. FL1348]